MEEQKHSPLPWKAEDTSVIADNGHYVCVSSMLRGSANMAFIERACNSHYELVEVVSQLIEMADNGTLHQPGHRADLWRDKLAKLARAALAKATGGDK